MDTLSAGPELYPSIAALRCGDRGVVERIQVHPNGLMSDYINKLSLPYSIGAPIEAIRTNDSTFHGIHTVDVVEPKNWKPGDRSYTEVQQEYDGADGAREWLRFCAAGEYKKPFLHAGHTTVVPLYSQFVNVTLENLFRRDSAFDIEHARTLFFTGHREAHELEKVMTDIKRRMLDIAEQGVQGGELSEITALCETGRSLYRSSV